MKAEVRVIEGLRTEAVSEKGFVMNMDSPVEVGGTDTSFAPMEAILMAWGGCTLADVASILHRKRIEFTDLRVRLNATRGKVHPRVFSEALLEYVLEAPADETHALHRSIRLSMGRYCPVSAMVKCSGTRFRVIATHNGRSLELVEPSRMDTDESRLWTEGEWEPKIA